MVSQKSVKDQLALKIITNFYYDIIDNWDTLLDRCVVGVKRKPYKELPYQCF